MTEPGYQSWKRALVYGLGMSGLAATRLLRRHRVEVVGVDSRSAADLDVAELAGDEGVELLLGSEPAALPDQIDGVVLSPGVPLDRPLVRAARSRALPVVAEVELAAAFLEGPLVAITGSNGKSTTTAMTGRLLRAADYEVEICGNIGVPLSSVVQGDAGRVFVAELSSFQLETIVSLRPRAAALLNISADHLDRHGSVEAYCAAKAAIFSNQTSDDVAIVNADDPLVAAIAVQARRRSFSRQGPVEDGCYVAAGRVVEVDPEGGTTDLFGIEEVPLPGVHNLENAMAATLMARSVGADVTAIRDGLAGFVGLPHRMERVADRNGVAWIDDSKGTNPAATLKSLEGFMDASVHLILGGRGKGLDPQVLREGVARKAKRIYLIGESAPAFASALGDVVAHEVSETLEVAVASAAVRAASGDTVLLSPACASFDQYRDFGERGNHFKALVKELEGGKSGQEAGV